MGTLSKAQQIVNRMETLALNLLTKATKDEAVIDVQLDVFEKVGKWVAGKNKLEDDGAGDLNDFKRRLQGETDKHAGNPRRNRHEAGGPRLEALKSRIPGRSNGSSDGDSDGAVGAADPAS